MYLLDTNACIRLLNKNGDLHFVEKFYLTNHVTIICIL